jgi:hypothetical protein
MTRLSIVLALFALLGAATARAQDPFADHYERASALYAGEAYADALKEYEAAYALRQPTRLLFDLARTHRKLGNARNALAYYQKFLAAEPEPEPAMRAEADAACAQLAQLVPPPPAQVPAPALTLPPGYVLQPVKLELRHDRGLIGGGIGLLTAGYAAALITGSIFASFGNNGSGYSSDSKGDLAAAGGTLIIPVAGPLISAFLYRDVVWSVPWALIDGGAQVAGLAMIIAGARVTKKVPVFSDRLRLAPYATNGGGGLLASGRF